LAFFGHSNTAAVLIETQIKVNCYDVHGNKIIIFSKGGARKAPKATTLWQPHQHTTEELAN